MINIEYHVAVKKDAQLISTLLEYLSLPSISSMLEKNSRVRKLGANATVYVTVIGSSRMRSLNSHYRNKDASTDVLSFELHENGVMGELYISPNDITANAKMMKHPFEHEFIEIFVHGILHLVGYDHEPEMFEWQKTITTNILEKYETYSRTGKSR